MAISWFLGDNDRSIAMYDPESGGGYDGLTDTGPNLNQGAESTLAMISTLQHGRTPAPAAASANAGVQLVNAVSRSATATRATPAPTSA